MSLSDTFFAAQQRVCAKIYYFQPLKVGQAPLDIPPSLIGAPSRRQNHSVLLQEFIYQKDDTPDLSPELAAIFRDLMTYSHGIVKIYDRRLALGEQTEEEQLSVQGRVLDGAFVRAAGSVETVQVAIPKLSEEMAKTPGADAFKSAIPFPRLRRFLQWWQEELDAPLHHIQYLATPVTGAPFTAQRVTPW